MLTLFSIIIIASGIIMLARSVLFWLYFIQTKQYRLDRIWTSIKSREFWKLIFSKHRIVIISFLVLAVLSIAYLTLTRPLDYLNAINGDRVARVNILKFEVWVLESAWLYFVVYAAITLRSLIFQRLKLPRFTAKITLLLFIIVAIEIILLQNFRFNHTLAYLTLEFFQPLLVFLIFVLVYTPNIFLHHYFINRAKRKIQAHKNLIVIGITGSYGKTSTKEFLAHILSKKFKVLKTPAHINVDTGVAKVILRDLKIPKVIPSEARDPLQLRMKSPRPSFTSGLAMTNDRPHEIFIVEMGAYCKGEIRKICNLVKPQYAIITGLSDQHLELFGSLKAIVEAKFELVEAISGQNGVVANADSKPLIIEFERRAERGLAHAERERRGWRPLWYGASERAQLKARHTTFTENGTEFQINNTPFRTPLIGSAALNNLLGAITMAQLLEMDLGDISRAVVDIPFVPHTMEPRLTPDNALIIDDTYNANTEGVITALNDLKYFNRPKKIFVFGEIIELGEKTKNDHIQIAKTIARTTNCVMLLPSRMRQIMYDTLIAEGYDKSHILDTRDRARLKDILNNDAVILLEGRGAEKILHNILNY